MSEKSSSNVQNNKSLTNSPGRYHQSSNTLDEDIGGSTVSLGSLTQQKKKSFFGSLRQTKKKHKSIEILKGQETLSEEIDPAKWQDQKEGDAERINLLNSVKEGRMSIEEAMKQAEELGVSSSSYNDAVGEETIFNFGVYKYTKNRASCSRRILQFDFQEKVLCTIQKGSRGKKFDFSQIRGFDSEDGVRFYIYFEDYHDYELDADTTEEKNKICTLLESITHQNKGDEVDAVFEAPAFVDKQIIKEGQVEKKGHSAAFLMWPRRWLRVQSGELSYFKLGEEHQPALNIIKLGPGLADAKKVDHNGFIVTTSKKEYCFRVIAKDAQSETRERDEWIAAIDEGSKVSVRGSRGTSLLQDQAFTSTFQEQEQYIKDMVKTLQRELEQLTSVLSVVNAPIQATVQVKKVKEVVTNLETHVKTGLLSWTMRQLKTRSDSTHDLENLSRTPPGSLPRQPSTKSSSGQPSAAITPIDEGYESITKPPGRPPKSPSSSYAPPPSRRPPPVSERTSSLPKCPLGNLPNPSSTSQRDNQTATVAHVAPYQTVEIAPSSEPQAPRIPDSSGATIPLYQHPTSNRGVVQDQRLECYDNVNIKNTPVSSESSAPAEQDEETLEVDAVKRLHHEIDAGGMGCQNINKAVQERKELYKEVEESGVVLLKVQHIEEDEDNQEETTITAPPAPPPLPGGLPPPPPPPPGSGGAPPPPPPMGGGAVVLDSALPSRKVAKPKKKLRPFFWNKVPLQMVTQSLWLGAQDRTNNLNLEALEEMFHMEEKDKPLPSVSSKPSAKMLLDPKKAHNLGIFLSGFKLSTKQIDEKLGIFKEKEGALKIDHVIALKRFLPTPDEQEMYKNIKEEDIPNLLQEDQFMIKLCEIPDLDKRLDLLLVIMEFPSQFEELAPAVTSVLDACHQLYSSQRFQIILEYVLAIGNYINGGTNRGGAYGFRLTTLTKMADIRGKEKKDTLLKYLILELQRTSPDSLLVVEDLKAIAKAADSSIKGLSAEVEVMRKDLGKIMKHSNDLLSKHQRTEPQDVKLVRDVDEFVAEYEEKLNDLCEKCKEMKYIYGKLLTRFGEPPSTDSEELFTVLTTFLTQFKKTLNEAESGPSAKKKIKLDGLTEAIAARVARLPQKEGSATTSERSTSDTTTTLFDTVDHSRASSHEVDGQKRASTNGSISSATEEDESPSGLPDIKPAQTNSPKVLNKKLSVKHSSSSPTPDRKLTPRPTKEGYLDKLSGGKHKAPKWDNRYFELGEGGHLHYYKKADGKIINTIYLRGCPVSIDDQEPTIILIKTEEREWSLRAPDAEEAKAWKESFEFYSKKTSSSSS